MKQPPRGAVFEMQQMKRVDFLTAVSQRLQDDVGSILSMIDIHNNQASLNRQRTIGYWAALRMILPIVEAVSHAMNVMPEQLLHSLNIQTPYLAWHLFRHSLMHGDYLQYGKYHGKTVSWTVLLTGSGHIFNSGNIGIDIPTLYNDFVNYLQIEISRNDQTIIDVEVGINYRKPSASIINDFSLL